jgi:hypothetical protein
MNKLIAFLLASAATLTAAPAFADTWQQDHPRRAEVNGRLENQHDRIDAGRRDGELNRHQARRLHREDAAIRNEERGMAAEHGGHITRRDQRILNRQENRVSRQIHRERARGR